jgi:hypothetical protein
MGQQQPSPEHGLDILRLLEQSCPHCSARPDKPMVVTTPVVYYCCGECGRLWAIDRPEGIPRKM